MVPALLFVLVICKRVSCLSDFATGSVLVKDSYPPCREINFHAESRVCEIQSSEDEEIILRFGLSGCYGSTLSCPEGDIKTCMPQLTINNLHYQCLCHRTSKQTLVDIDAYWTEWVRLTQHFRGFVYKRELLANSGADIVTVEYSMAVDTPQYIVSAYSLSDSVFSASSQLGEDRSYGPFKARLDNYIGPECCWAAAPDDPETPWLQISLPGQYTVIGVHIRQRCRTYPLEYPTVVSVSRSDGDGQWQEVLIQENIASRYSSYDSKAKGVANVWFSQKYTTLYWKIYIIQYEEMAAMKCDLIGYSN